MKQILFMMPSYYNFDEVVKDGLIKYSGFTVNSIDTVDKKIYKNTLARVHNFLSKVFLNTNLKPELRRKFFSQSIDKFSSYEYLIVNRPDILTEEILKKAINKSKKSVLLLWDSLEKIPIRTEIISKFDIIYSFDKADCEKYGFKKIENFHFFDIAVGEKAIHDFDVSYLGTFDDRISSLTTILEHLHSLGKKTNAQVYVPSNKRFKKGSNINILKKITPFKDSAKHALNSKIILDIGHPNQTGLSFRFFEAMAYRKKVITTNKHIIHYDFYHENNIFVIEDVNNIDIPKSFWESPYHELPEQMVEKYHIKNWVEKIINGK